MTLKVNDLLISADGTYPGIVTKLIDEYFVRVKFYKWGYDSSDVDHGPLLITQAVPLLATPADIRKKFWTLPKEYDETIVTTGEKIEQLQKHVDDFAAAVSYRDEYFGEQVEVDTAWAALVKFYLEGQG